MDSSSITREVCPCGVERRVTSLDSLTGTQYARGGYATAAAALTDPNKGWRNEEPPCALSPAMAERMARAMRKLNKSVENGTMPTIDILGVQPMWLGIKDSTQMAAFELSFAGTWPQEFKDQRYGQAWVNALRDADPWLGHMVIQNKNVDPWNDDSKVPAARTYIEEVLFKVVRE